MIRRAIIIGGGVGGLCSAIGLRQEGIEAIVYEQAEELNAVGAGLTLWANSIKALRKLGLAAAVIRTGSKIGCGGIRTAGGRTLARTELGGLEQLFGEPTIAIHRAELQKILLSALPPDALCVNAQCIGIDQANDHAAIHIRDGRRDQGDLVIGAVGSVLREGPAARLDRFASAPILPTHRANR
jgi:FAD-dependent urate hydroxylase